MKKICFVIALIISLIGRAQDVSMQNGSFNRCAPDKFFDSGGEFGNYSNSENLVTTLCPQNVDEFLILEFTSFMTQLNQDTITIYDGDDTSAPELGSWSGPNTPGTVSATTSNTSGCLTIVFNSDGDSSGTGWEANILCATSCQEIEASINTTTPAVNASGIVGILPGDTVDFVGSAIFSEDGTNANYEWTFGDGNTASGTNVSNTFDTPGTYSVWFTVSDDNPQGCADTAIITVFVLGPNIVVDQNAFTPEELITNVLVNSPCATVTNVISQTGTDFGFAEPNGIGYFFSNGIDFPFEDGILLTSGNASEAMGPNENLLEAGSPAWPGDPDLNAAIPGVQSNNATFIQFDFTPLADRISFEFLMASEEYDMGGFECQFSDAFAFLLTDATGTTTNLAVLPGTTTPILVTNIHPDNGSCGAANPQFFGEYTPQNGPPISFDGRTAVFTAEADVIPGETYTIKLVVADDRDTVYDTGVFLKAGSFDLGGDLGDDITIAAGTAECGGNPVTLDTGITTAAHTWYFEGTEISGETTSTLTVTETGTYSVDVIFTGICQASDDIFVEFKPDPTANPAQPLQICDANEVAEFNLSENDSNILGTQNPEDFIITYHLTEQDAIDNIGILPPVYTNTASPQVIWARIADNSQECFATTDFLLQFSDIIIENAITPLVVCDDTISDGLTVFTLTDRDAEIIGTNINVAVSYHLTAEDAENNSFPLPESYTNTTPNSQTIYARLQDLNTADCYATAPLNLEVIAPPLANLPLDYVLCDDTTPDGFTTFDLSTKDAEIIGAQTNVNVTYHLVPEDAISGLNALPNLYTNTTSNLQEIYVRIESVLAGCYATTSLQLIVNALPVLGTPLPIVLCDIDNPGDEQEPFNLDLASASILNGQTGISLTYYATASDADIGSNALVLPYTNVSNPQTIFVRGEDNTTGCYNTTSFTLEVNPLPVFVLPTPLAVCDDGTPDGLVSIDLSVKDAEITGNNPGYLVSYHVTNLEAETGSNALVLPYTNVTNPQTVYARVEDATTGCYITTSLDLEVAQAPVATVPDAFLYCDPDNDGFGVFDLTDLDAEITGGIPGLTVSYHETEVNAELGVNAIPNPTSYLNIEAPTQELYARVESSSIATDCASVVSVELVVEPTPQLVAPSVALEACDDISADGFAVFDLTVDLQDLLNGLDPANYDFSYYETQADADQDINAIVNPQGYTNTIANNQTIWIRVSDPNTLGSCYSLTSLALQVNPLPVLVQPTPLALCDDLGEVPGDGLRVFDLTVKDPEITGGNGSWVVAYYETALEAQTQTNAIADPTQYSNTSIDGLPANPQTLYVVVTNPDTGCINSTTLTLRVLPNPTPTPSASLPELELCDTINTGDGVEAFDLTLNEGLIRNGEFGVTVSYYETQDDAASGTNAIADPSQYSNISATQIIYVRVTNDDTGCYALVEFTIRLNPLPEVIAVSDLIQCELNTDGQDSFMLSSKDAEVLNGQDPSTYVVSYHVSASEAALGINALQSPYTNVSNPQTIYVAITNTNTGCAISTPQFNIQVDEAAQANPDGEVIVYELCDDALETDGDPSNDSVQFDLSTQDQAILDGQDPANYQVRYYATLEGAELGVDPLPNLYENISNPQTIYARVDNNTLGVIPIALDLSALTSGLDFNADGIIDTYDTDGDGVLDLIDINGDGFSDAIDANGDGLYEYIDTNGDGLPDPVDLNNDGIFDNQQDNSICYSVASLILQVNSLPNFSIAESYIRCINTNGTEVIPPLVIDTELSATAYSFVWTLNGEVIPDAQGPTLTPNAAGLYTVTVSDISSSLVTSCSLSAQTEVLDSEPPVLTAEVVTQAFANTHVIEAIAEGLGEYEYSLDDGPWQDSGSFTDVSAGTHEVIARDKNGCGITRVSVFVLDYPLYFTPNGDGTNELWQISGIGNSAKIYIFDRYGKLLKQLSPSGPGWDGTYNGNIMPSSDYWFIVEYDEPATGERKEYKAHFTLKR